MIAYTATTERTAGHLVTLAVTARDADKAHDGAGPIVGSCRVNVALDRRGRIDWLFAYDARGQIDTIRATAEAWTGAEAGR